VNRILVKTPAAGVDANLWQETGVSFIVIQLDIKFDMDEPDRPASFRIGVKLTNLIY
jgi:hypothetical protein